MLFRCFVPDLTDTTSLSAKIVPEMNGYDVFKMSPVYSRSWHFTRLDNIIKAARFFSIIRLLKTDSNINFHGNAFVKREMERLCSERHKTRLSYKLFTQLSYHILFQVITEGGKKKSRDRFCPKRLLSRLN